MNSHGLRSKKRSLVLTERDIQLAIDKFYKTKQMKNNSIIDNDYESFVYDQRIKIRTLYSVIAGLSVIVTAMAITLIVTSKNNIDLAKSNLNLLEANQSLKNNLLTQ